jgi:hypothetical protein
MTGTPYKLPPCVETMTGYGRTLLQLGYWLTYYAVQTGG